MTDDADTDSDAGHEENEAAYTLERNQVDRVWLSSVFHHHSLTLDVLQRCAFGSLVALVVLLCNTLALCVLWQAHKSHGVSAANSPLPESYATRLSDLEFRTGILETRYVSQFELQLMIDGNDGRLASLEQRLDAFPNHVEERLDTFHTHLAQLAHGLQVMERLASLYTSENDNLKQSIHGLSSTVTQMSSEFRNRIRMIETRSEVRYVAH